MESGEKLSPILLELPWEAWVDWCREDTTAQMVAEPAVLMVEAQGVEQGDMNPSITLQSEQAWYLVLC